MPEKPTRRRLLGSAPAAGSELFCLSAMGSRSGGSGVGAGARVWRVLERRQRREKGGGKRMGSTKANQEACKMRREGRQRGWVCVVDLSLVDPEGKKSRRRRGVVPVESASVVANGGFVRAPRKPTNHSKPSVGRAYKYLMGRDAGGGSSGKGVHKFKHDEVKTYYLELEGGVYDADAALEFYD